MSDENEPRKNRLQVPIDPITIAEIASIAKSRIKKEFWDYYDCGADSQTVLHDNEAAFKA
jgi:(S)-2-hydroxy-acid oxidase